MKSPNLHFRHAAGATLIEAVIAVGVLAVAVPLVFGTIAEAGRGGQSARAETRAPWIVRTCMEEIQASRDGRPRYFSTTKVGQPFPPAGDVWALAFSADGKPLGKLSKTLYDKGSKELNGKPVSYIAVISAATQPPLPNTTPMLKSRVAIEYPAAAPAKKRAKLDFHTRIP
jgi:type II secretory pathway pseudopilin PulG